MQPFLYQASLYLAAMVIAVPLSTRFGLGSVLGYLAAGIIIGPVLGLVGAETAELQHFAEFGVVFMLFLIGLELEPRALWEMRHRLLGLGGLQVILTTAALALGGYALGYPLQSALAMGLILALSSTAIVLQTLTEKGLMQSSGGRASFAVLLTQDIAVIPILAILPLLVVVSPEFGQDGSIHRLSEQASSGHQGSDISQLLPFIDELPSWGPTLITLSVVLFVLLAAIFLIRPLFQYIHATRSREMYTALALLIVIGIAFLMSLVGLSPALGTFLAGVVLANSEFRHQLESDIEPFKGLLLGLFFITVGAGVNFSILAAAPLEIIGLTVAVITIKALVLFLLSFVFRMTRRGRLLFTLSLAQAGEFGFVLLSFSVQQSVFPVGLSQKLLLVVALSMLVTPLLFILSDVLRRKLSEPADQVDDDIITETGPVIIAGIGRFGQIVNRLVQSSGFQTVVLDNSFATIQLMRGFGFRGFLGDASRIEVLRAAGLADARVLVVALDTVEATNRVVTIARKERPDLHIIARARSRGHAFQLYKLGADDIVRELFDSSLRAGRYALEKMGLAEFEAEEAARAFYFHDRSALKELAEVWDPEIPSTKNAAYLAKAKELEKELEARMTSLFDKLDAAE